MIDPDHAPEGTPERRGRLAPRQTHCANCGAELMGPYCYRCGQSTKHTLKHLPALAADATDAVFNIDGRIMRTVPALYFHPGFLAREYFAGRRMRYIPPFRLMFFMSVLAFLLIHLALMLDQPLAHPLASGGSDTIPSAVQADARHALARIEAARAKPDIPAVGQLALRLAAHTISSAANQRVHEPGTSPLPTTAAPALPSTAAVAGKLQAIATAPSTDAVNARANTMATTIANSMGHIGQASPAALVWLGNLQGSVEQARRQGLKRLQQAPSGPPATPATPRIPVPAFASSAAHKRTAPHIGINVSDIANAAPRRLGSAKFDEVHIGWLPAFANNRINDGIRQAQKNINELTHGSASTRSQARRRVIRNFLAVTPPTLFVLMPLVALLLKVLYVFKSRLYIEHLIVTLYSHAFIFMTLFLSVLLGMIAARLPQIRTGSGLLQAAIWIWFAAYLLLMQKRIYAQGWFFTVVKYCCTGVCYGILLTFTLIVAALIGLAR